MADRDRMIRDSLILFVATTITIAAKFGYHMYVSRKLGAEAYGALVTILGMLILLTLPVNALQLAVTKRVSVLKARQEWDGVRQVFLSSSFWFLGVGIALFLLLAAASGLICHFFKIEDRTLILFLALMAIPNLLLPAARGALQGLQRFVTFGLTGILDGVLKIVIAALLLLIGWHLRGAVLANVFSAAAALAFAYVVLAKVLPRLHGPHPTEPTQMDAMFGYALPVFLSLLGFSLLGYLDVFMVKHFFNAHEAGLYSGTSIIGKAFLYLPDAIAMTLFPKASDLYARNQDTRPLLVKAFLLTAALTLAGIIVCRVAPGLIVALLFGPQFQQIAKLVRVFGLAITPLVFLNVVINYSLAIHRYTFLYALYGGILAYGLLLWFFHASLGQVLAILFLANLITLVLSLVLLQFRGSEKKDGPSAP